MSASFCHLSISRRSSHLSPKKSLPTTDAVMGQFKNSLDLSMIFVFLRAYLNKWPSTKTEISQHLAKLPIGASKSELLLRIWQTIYPEIEDSDLEKFSSYTTDDWKVSLRSLLQRISSIDGTAQCFSQDFLGEFVKDFAHAKFGGDLKSVYDPAFGFGNILFTAFDGSRQSKEIWVDDEGEEFESKSIVARTIKGNEINSETCKLVKVLGELCGYKLEISNQNSLVIQDTVSTKHDLVVCEPPVGQKLSTELLMQDWDYGRPPSGRADWAWAQVVCKSLSLNGYGLIFLTRGALFHKTESLIRAKFINSGLIRAVINLPSGSNWSTRLPMSLIVVAGDSVPRSTNDEILYLSLPEPKGRPGTWEYPTSLINSIHNACEVFYQFEAGNFQRVIGYSAAVQRNDKILLNNAWNLDPSNYVTQVATGINVQLSVRKDMNDISKSGIDLVNQISRTKEKFSSFSVKAEFTTIGEMIRSGKLIQVTGMSKNDLKKDKLLDSNTESFFTVQDLRKIGPLEATGKVSWENEFEDREETRTEVNDVVFIKTGTPAAKVDYYGGSLLFSPLSVLRITEQGEKIITPKILAFILNGESIKKFMHGVTVGRLDIEKVPIPILYSINRDEIDDHLLAVEKLIVKTNQLSNHLNELDQKLGKVLWGEFEGLQEAE